MKTMASTSNARGVLTKLLKRGGLAAIDLANARRADALVDEALDVLDHEEPELREYLNSMEVEELLRVQTSASYALIVRDNRRGLPLEDMVHRLQTLNFRTICAVALAAAMHERPRAADWEVHE